MSHNKKDTHVAKGGFSMGIKGQETQKFICQEAYKLFAKRGYKDVTMQDICEKTGLSRGGLYRHFNSTKDIFLEIINQSLNSQQNEFQSKIEANIPASHILDEVLKRYEKEMIDSKNSLSLAIYEFFSNPEISKSVNSISKQYSISKEMWIALIEYGQKTGEFKNVEPEEIYNLIVFSYQGVRMYSRLMKINSDIPAKIINQIKHILLF